MPTPDLAKLRSKISSGGAGGPRIVRAPPPRHAIPARARIEDAAEAFGAEVVIVAIIGGGLVGLGIGVWECWGVSSLIGALVWCLLRTVGYGLTVGIIGLGLLRGRGLVMRHLVKVIALVAMLVGYWILFA